MRKLIAAAMAEDFSWERSAAAYKRARLRSDVAVNGSSAQI
jgi:hypothetical protein